MNKYIYAINRRLSSLYVALFDRRFDRHNDFTLKNFEEFFSHSPSNFNDEFILNEICKFYKKSKENQKKKDIEYQVGNEWLPIYSKYMSEIVDVLSQKNLQELSKKYNNFFREKFSTGLHGDSGHERLKKRFFSEKISFVDKNLYIKGCLYAFDVWKKLIKEKEIDCNLNDLVVPSIGNQYYFKFDGEKINPNYFSNHYYANFVSKLLNQNLEQKKYVFELGGGYGAFAYFLMKENNYCYIGCDLPENLCLSAFFLQSLLPNKKIILVSDLNTEKVDFSKYDIILISNYDIENLPDNIIDFSYNSYSLAEMHTEAIENYIKHINRISKNFIFHINHSQYTSNSADNFKFDLNKFYLVEKKTAIWNKYINKLSDEYEYLYKRK